MALGLGVPALPVTRGPLVVLLGRGWGQGQACLLWSSVGTPFCAPAWAPHGLSLTQHNSFGVGDVVRVMDDLDTVKRLQARHGEWTDDMAPVSLPAPPQPPPPPPGDLPVTPPLPT